MNGDEMFIKKVFERVPKSTLLYYILVGGWLGTTAMHIPDGYLSPVTSIIMFVLVLPFWVKGVHKMREKMTAKNIPIIALFAAFSFIIMMFNVPLPGGTTGHAVGGALAAIILGPEIACIAISIALITQAFFFGDGGILAIGANCFNMAVVLPYVSYGIYQWIAKNIPLTSKRRIVGAVVSAWTGLTTASFFAAVEFGIQPLIWHTADGVPLYCPYPLSVSIPAMVIPHALIASVVEAIVTGGVVAYLMNANPSALEIINKTRIVPEVNAPSKWRGLWIGLAVLIFITPIGLLAPGTAWGEWGAKELTSIGINFIPPGLEKLSTLWSAPLPDYDIPILGNPTISYVLSAAIGILITIGVIWLITRLATRKSKPVEVSIHK
jgi:cobalt/nickel transport system permease protein